MTREGGLQRFWRKPWQDKVRAIRANFRVGMRLLGIAARPKATGINFEDTTRTFMEKSEAHLIDGVICSSEIDGRAVKFFVSNRVDHIQQHHLKGEFYEQKELMLIAEYFEKGGVFADIGANVGNHSLYVGLFLAPTAIIPFEPNPAVLPTLRINLLLNRLSHIADGTHIDVGLSDKSGYAKVIMPDTRNLGGAKLQSADDTGTIQLMQGDLALGDRKVDFIKIDVEGMEMRVLAGLAMTIKRCRPKLFIEVDNSNMAAFSEWVTNNEYCVVERFRRYVENENYMVIPQERG